MKNKAEWMEELEYLEGLEEIQILTREPGGSSYKILCAHCSKRKKNIDKKDLVKLGYSRVTTTLDTFIRLLMGGEKRRSSP